MAKICELNKLGQSIWLDEIQRGMIVSGKLGQLIKEGVTGLTSNPSIFEKSIDQSSDYDEQIASLVHEGVKNPKVIYEALAIKDIQSAADLLLPVYTKTECADGFVSMEVSPHLALDATGTIDEAKRLWKVIGRKNVMIKIPGTNEGLVAIRQLLADGININVTLLFSSETYRKVFTSFVEGLEAFEAEGGDLTKVNSVASFFVSRIDVACDKVISEKLKTSINSEEKAQLKTLLGKVGIANSTLAYQEYLRFIATERWKRLAKMGAHPQKVLWASTSVKNILYSDVLYVESLAVDQTINTLPPRTLAAFEGHGTLSPLTKLKFGDAEKTLKSFDALGICREDILSQLLSDGLKSFMLSFDAIMKFLEKKRTSIIDGDLNRQTLFLSEDLASKTNVVSEQWESSEKMKRLWAKDSSVWTNQGESRWLGWLNVVHGEQDRISEIEDFAKMVQAEGFSHILLMGMGGSSLCSEVMSKTFKPAPKYPQLIVLDSTDPDQIHEVETKIDLNRTLFVVSSKSGVTTEPNILCQYFSERVRRLGGKDKAIGMKFIAITDPGSPLEILAIQNGFRKIFHGVTAIGGRYSALSDFGIIPAALMGINVRDFLKRTLTMMNACGPNVRLEENPAASLGFLLGSSGLGRRNKVTLFCSEKIKSLGLWLEQLLAESTGKHGKGLIPITGETIGEPQCYGDDRIFIYLKVDTDRDEKFDASLLKLQNSGCPVVKIVMKDIYGLGQEYFRWEMAVAIAGSILQINPFDQPDVEASKNAAKELADEFERTGHLRLEKLIYEEEGIQVFGDEPSPTQSQKGISLVDALKTCVGQIKVGDYFGLLAYLPTDSRCESKMQDMRLAIRNSKKVATCLEFGPRYLHSTGQVYKGGPNTGVFIEITSDHEYDLPIPAHRATFAVIEMAQAKGDFQVLTTQKKRRAIRVHLKTDFERNLKKLSTAFDEALR